MNFKYVFAVVFAIATLVLDTEALFFKKSRRNNQNVLHEMNAIVITNVGQESV